METIKCNTDRTTCGKLLIANDSRMLRINLKMFNRNAVRRQPVIVQKNLINECIQEYLCSNLVSNLSCWARSYSRFVTSFTDYITTYSKDRGAFSVSLKKIIFSAADLRMLWFYSLHFFNSIVSMMCLLYVHITKRNNHDCFIYKINVSF